MSNGNQVSTISLSMIRGCSKSMTVGGRLIDVSGALKTDTLFYCRAVLVDDTGSMQVTFWNMNDVTHAQILSFEGQCVFVTAVQIGNSREGYQDRSRFCISYNGGITSTEQQQGKKFRPTPTSTIHSVPDRQNWPVRISARYCRSCFFSRSHNHSCKARASSTRRPHPLHMREM